METYTEDEFMKLTDKEKWIAYGELLEKYVRMKRHPPFAPLLLCKTEGGMMYTTKHEKYPATANFIIAK